VVALRLNVDFSDAGLLAGTSGLHFGDLILANFTSTMDFGLGPVDLTNLNGLTVRQFLADANTAMGGGLAIDDVFYLALVSVQVNGSFGEGLVSPFAQDHLVAPAAPVCTQPSNACGPTTVPEPSSLAARLRCVRHCRSPAATRPDRGVPDAAIAAAGMLRSLQRAVPFQRRAPLTTKSASRSPHSVQRKAVPLLGGSGEHSAAILR
jgi:hypothetical protein